MSKLLENMIPEGAKKFEKKTEEVPNASKKGPGELPRPKMRPAKSRDGLQKGPWDPRGAPEANQDRKVSNSLSKIDGFEKKHQIPKVKQRVCS